MHSAFGFRGTREIFILVLKNVSGRQQTHINLVFLACVVSENGGQYFTSIPPPPPTPRGEFPYSATEGIGGIPPIF
jgi:hypothetical protein